jgi:DNA repair exonuclease SbcCD nuclease subunit
MFRFLHAADLHLDSPLRGLEQYDGAPVEEIRGATRRALENLADLAIESAVDFVLIAGDIYDGDWKDHNTGLFFVSQMVRLRDAGIPVVMICGNHDAANKMTKSLSLPDNVELLGHARAQTAKSKKLFDLGVAVHGQSFAKEAEFRNLVPNYPDKKSGMFNIGLLHTALSGATGHAPYAPCSLDDLRTKGYGYWALGHVHQRQVVCNDPFVVFSGNSQGRHIREADTKGCYLIAVDDGDNATPEFQPLDVFRWETCEVAARGLKRADQVLERYSERLRELAPKHAPLPMAVRVTVNGACAAHGELNADSVRWTNEFRSIAADVGSGSIWLEKVRFQTSPEMAYDPDGLAEGPLRELEEYFRELQSDDVELAEVARELGELQKKLPDELRRGDDGLRVNDLGWLRKTLGEVEPLLIQRVFEKGRA